MGGRGGRGGPARAARPGPPGPHLQHQRVGHGVRLQQRQRQLQRPRAAPRRRHHLPPLPGPLRDRVTAAAWAAPGGGAGGGTGGPCRVAAGTRRRRHGGGGGVGAGPGGGRGRRRGGREDHLPGRQRRGQVQVCGRAGARRPAGPRGRGGGRGLTLRRSLSAGCWRGSCSTDCIHAPRRSGPSIPTRAAGAAPQPAGRWGGEGRGGRRAAGPARGAAAALCRQSLRGEGTCTSVGSLTRSQPPPAALHLRPDAVQAPRSRGREAGPSG